MWCTCPNCRTLFIIAFKLGVLDLLLGIIQRYYAHAHYTAAAHIILLIYDPSESVEHYYAGHSMHMYVHNVNGKIDNNVKHTINRRKVQQCACCMLAHIDMVCFIYIQNSFCVLFPM